jgi:hypothetical protein
MEAGAATPEERRKGAVELLKRELREDVAEMRQVYARGPKDVIWDDLAPFTAGDDRARKTLVTDIRAQVQSGLTLVSGQPMNELAG